MTVEVVIPFAGDCEHRARALEWVRDRYPWPVTVAPGPEPWSKAAAVMPAIAASTADIIVVADGDVWCDTIAASVADVEAGAAWAIPHRGVFRLNATSTGRMLGPDAQDFEYWFDLEQRAYGGVEGGGIVIAHRHLLQAVPMDPRFVGWGQEDESWGLALRCLLGPPERRAGHLVHLWHPPQPRQTRRCGSTASWRLRSRYMAAFENPAAMRRLLTEAHLALDTPHEAVHDHAPH